MRVAPTRTPLSLDQIQETFAALARDGEISRRAVPILTSLVAIENARGGSIFGHNWGNITTADPSDMHFVFDGNPRLFLQFGSHAEGARALLTRLGSATHKRMLEAADRGNVKAFVQGMTTPHPQTGMMYCDTCEPISTLHGYQAMVRSLGGGKGGGGLGLALAIALPIASLGVAAWRVLR